MFRCLHSYIYSCVRAGWHAGLPGSAGICESHHGPVTVTRRQNLIPPLRPTCASGFSNCPDLVVAGFHGCGALFLSFHLLRVILAAAVGGGPSYLPREVVASVTSPDM